MSDIADRVKKIVVENLGVDAGDVNEAASFIHITGINAEVFNLSLIHISEPTRPY